MPKYVATMLLYFSRHLVNLVALKQYDTLKRHLLKYKLVESVAEIFLTLGKNCVAMTLNVTRGHKVLNSTALGLVSIVFYAVRFSF